MNDTPNDSPNDTPNDSPGKFSLSDAAFLRTPFFQQVAAALQGESKGKSLVRFVGGAVRNALLGLSSKDVDLATPLEPHEVARRLQARGLRVIPTGLAHGTVRVVEGRSTTSSRSGLSGGERERESCEITTLRRDVETYGRRARVAFTDDWAEDALRRDFTVNALSFDPATGEGWDYVGGVADLRACRLRFIGVPSERIVEDYLRILRLFRFLSQYPRFVAEEAGLRACCEHQGGLSGLSGERLLSELLLLLGGEDPCGALRLMGRWGVCAVAGWRFSEGVLSALERMVSFERELDCEDASRRLLFLVACGTGGEGGGAEGEGAEGEEAREVLKKKLTKRLIFATIERKRFASLDKGFLKEFGGASLGGGARS